MILYDVECRTCGWRNEVLLTTEERDNVLREHGVIAVPCGSALGLCSGLAVKDPVAKTGNNSLQWKRAAHGESR